MSGLRFRSTIVVMCSLGIVMTEVVSQKVMYLEEQEVHQFKTSKEVSPPSPQDALLLGLGFSRVY